MIRYQVDLRKHHYLSAHPLFVTEDDGFCNAVQKIRFVEIEYLAMHYSIHIHNREIASITK